MTKALLMTKALMTKTSAWFKRALGTALVAAIASPFLAGTSIAATESKAAAESKAVADSRVEAPRVAGSYIVALRVKDGQQAGLRPADGVAILADPAAFAHFAAEALAPLSLAKPARYLATLSSAEAFSPRSNEEGQAGGGELAVRVDLTGPISGQLAELEALMQAGVIAYYEPNYLSKPYSSTATPTVDTFGDVLPRYRDYLNGDCSGDGTECHLRYEQIQMISALEAIKATPLSQAPVIAVMDSGVDFTHPALAGKLWQNSPTQKGISGCTDDTFGCDTTQSASGSLGQGATVFPTGTEGPGESCPPISQQGGNCIHGTHIAGIIAATIQKENGYAYPGVCPSCRVLSVKIVGPTKDGTNTGKYSIADSSIIAGLTYIENFSKRVKPVKVVNASFGKFHASRTVESLLRRLQDGGILFVAATGNESTEKPSYPAAFEDVIAVANISKRSRAKHENSNYGTWVDISAPGSGFSGITSTKPGGDYVPLIGTSMAAPMVAAVAGLVWAQNPGLSAGEVASRILNGADQSMYDVAENRPYLLSSGGKTQTLLGRGSLNAANAVQGLVGNSLPATSRNLAPACGTVHISGSASGKPQPWWLLYLLPAFALLGSRWYPWSWPKP